MEIILSKFYEINLVSWQLKKVASQKIIDCLLSFFLFKKYNFYKFLAIRSELNSPWDKIV